MDNLIGRELGRFHILEQLGEGGMATVYKAYDTRLERDVAVKIIRTELFGSAMMERLLKRFEREAKALARLTHPNIVHVNDYGEQEGIPYLVMDYLPGGTLKQYLGKPMPWQEAVRLLLPIADAVVYAHEQNIVHRDIKPSNILLTIKGQPMLTDFGIAKILEGEETQTLTGTGVGVGTPEYMAPEQWTGQANPQADLYSLGVVLYELVTGRTPYTADTPAAILLKQATEPLPRPTQFVPDLPETVEKVLFKALAKKPEDRYQSMGEFVSALEKLLAVPIEAGKATTRQVISTPANPASASILEEEPTKGMREGRRVRNKYIWPAIGSVVLLLCILLGGGGWLLWMGTKGLGSLTRRATSTPTSTITPSMTPTYTLTPTPKSIHVGCPIGDWSIIGTGTWNCNGDVVEAHSTKGDGLLISKVIYKDMTFSATVSTQNREASLAIHMQDANNGYIVVFIPDGSSWNKGVGGIWLVKRTNNNEATLGYYHVAGFPKLGEQVQLSVSAEGSRIIVSLNNNEVIQLSDSSFSSGYAGLRIYGDSAIPCDSTFQNISIQDNTNK